MHLSCEHPHEKWSTSTEYGVLQYFVLLLKLKFSSVQGYAGEPLVRGLALTVHAVQLEKAGT